MAREINSNLLERLKKGDLLPLLDYIKSDSDLRFEVRSGGKAVVYYRKGKALEIANGGFNVDEKYGNVPPKDLAGNTPKEYFQQIKKVIDDWVENSQKKHRPEFDTQQCIARDNQDKNDAYFILDMEYNFAQDRIDKSDRVKRAGFDLLGIERLTGKVVFFEVKKGLESLTGKAGIKSHINDFETCLYGKNSDVFRENLETDIKNIVHDKTELGIIDNYTLPADFCLKNMDIDLVFIFEPNDPDDRDKYDKIFEKERINSKGAHKKYKTIFVTSTNYKLI
ncbi:MAG: hypothetical protein LBE71_04605 [Dysgonamonadaceae bacterium]|jgi:hypothetical protein|nr:hypothetical protein [Dysgonamonadaceae bacterium]